MIKKYCGNTPRCITYNTKLRHLDEQVKFSVDPLYMLNDKIRV